MDGLVPTAFDPDRMLSIVGSSSLGSAERSLAALEMAPGTTGQTDIDRAIHLFQNVLVEEMVKAMRKATPKAELFGNSTGKEIFESFLDAEYAKALGENLESAGLVDAIKRQLGIENQEL